MIIDFHTHIFPDALAPKALVPLAQSAGLTPSFDGTASGLLSMMAGSGVDHSITLNIAVTPSQETNVNNFAIQSELEPRFTSFGSVHPYSDKALGEVARIKEAGLRGAKFHPEYQQFPMDDPAAFPVYDLCCELGLVMIFHGGWDIAFPDSRNAYPDKVINFLKRYPNAWPVIAHMGGYAVWSEVRDAFRGLNFYMDTALTTHIPKNLAWEIIKTFGPDRILFGTDAPWDSQKKTIDYIDSLPLSSAEKDLIYCENAKRILGI